MRLNLLACALALFTLVAACSPAPATSTLAPTEAANVGTAPASAADAATAIPFDDTAAATRAEWQTLPLVNARTCETFTLADYVGKTVFVETMATWCSNCREQMAQVRDAREQLGEEQFAYIGLSVEVGLDPATLAAYVDEQNYPWTFAVLSPEMLAALTTAFGQSITLPPATPHFILYADGAVSPLQIGRILPADELIMRLQPAV